MKIRNDINGLRALAVIPVLFFHSAHSWLPGGFLGVDVFFVISGYLITNLIYSELSAGKFSFINFYDRRARRILPALLVVLLASTLASLFFMVPYDIKNYGQSLVASILSANNILLYFTSGYWSLASEFKPLYHTWSLAVEEQYYFVVPFAMFYCFRVLGASRAIFALMSLLFLGSFLVSLSSVDKEYNFLIIFTRVWELLAGGLLALRVSRYPGEGNQPLALLGFLLIMLSYVKPNLISEKQVFVNALPVIGALLVIRFADEGGNGHTILGRVLSIRPLVTIGLISYSTYLWHQPLLAFLRLASEYEPDTIWQVAVSLLSMPLAYFTWRYIEQPFRDRLIVGPRLFYASIGCVMLSLVGIGLLMNKTYGFQSYWPEYSYGGNPQSYVDAPKVYKLPSFEDDGRPKILVVGSSFARDFINMMSENDLLRKFDLVYFEGDCLSGEGGNLNNLLAQSQYVVYAGAWGQRDFSEAVVESVMACSRHLSKVAVDGEVFVLGVKNFGWNNNFVRLVPREEAENYRVLPLTSVLKFNESAREEIVGYVDILQYLMKDGKVRIFDEEGRFITYDTNHLTKGGARYVGNVIFSKGPLSVLTTVQVAGRGMNGVERLIH